MHYDQSVLAVQPIPPVLEIVDAIRFYKLLMQSSTMLNSSEHEILNVRKYKRIKKFSFLRLRY